MNRLVLSLLVENNPGVLSRVAGLFSRRGYGIDSLSVGKLVEVIEIFPLKPEESVYRELVLIKVEADEMHRSSIVSIADIFRARIIDVAPSSLVIEATGDQSKIDGLLAMLEGFNIVEIVRTGLSGIKRGLGEIDIKSHINK